MQCLQESLEAAHAGRTRHGSHRMGRHPGETLDEAVARHRSTAAVLLVREGHSSTKQKSSLETQRWLEEVLDMYILAQYPDGRAVMLSQDVAEAGSECEALDRASSCHSAAHGSPHLVGHQTDQRQNELGTDLDQL